VESGGLFAIRRGETKQRIAILVYVGVVVEIYYKRTVLAEKRGRFADRTAHGEAGTTTAGAGNGLTECGDL